ncbi:hypothetical protein F4778DRAFT_783597 [Xylariomycetidae sp. FL2044]|nr:hypothetical protein F4778DRAFT_783597 [Xylariomycetidae sp. FL2044]
MSAKGNASAVNTDGTLPQKDKPTVAMDEYLKAPPTVTERLATSSSSGGDVSAFQMEDLSRKETKRYLDDWQARWK